MYIGYFLHVNLFIAELPYFKLFQKDIYRRKKTIRIKLINPLAIYFFRAYNWQQQIKQALKKKVEISTTHSEPRLMGSGRYGNFENHF
ncbi:hypothetical protein M5C72_04750 [Companilactobacillus allii]|uniref:hypothetical protein n=1 Tax=Companilactobacillus allii TaxID=1847728 RepID=UPI00208E9DBB|nr:hypothetical protein [Companilactobacillus allii]USQ69532.1 hypothetical protein M5C72_04750 [Companilactobacillus allii]